MATSNRIRALNRLPFDFEDGLKVGGVDVTNLKQFNTAAGAGLVGFTPVGGLSATNVQAAIAELDTEKARLDALAANNGTPGAALVGYDGGTLKDVADNAKPLANYTALRAYTGSATQVRITQTGLDGFFYRDDSDTASADNGGTIIVATNGKRWKRIFTGVVNVKWFGAVGNGLVDDTLSIQTAIDSLGSTSTILFPNGQYTCSSTVVLGGTKKKITIIGYGATLKFTSVSHGLDMSSPVGQYDQYHKIMGLTISGPDPELPSSDYVHVSAGAGLYLKNTYSCVFTDVQVLGFLYGLYIENVIDNQCNGSTRFTSNGYGVYLTGAANANSFYSTKIRQNRIAGIYFNKNDQYSPTSNMFVSCLLESNNPYLGGWVPPPGDGSFSVGIKMSYAYDNIFQGCFFENNEYSIWLEKSTSGNKFNNCRFETYGSRPDKIRINNEGATCNNNTFINNTWIPVDTTTPSIEVVGTSHFGNQFIGSIGVNILSGSIQGSVDIRDSRYFTNFYGHSFGALTHAKQGVVGLGGEGTTRGRIEGIGTTSAKLYMEGLGEFYSSNALTADTTITSFIGLTPNQFFTVSHANDTYKLTIASSTDATGKIFLKHRGTVTLSSIGDSVTFYVNAQGRAVEVGRSIRGTYASLAATPGTIAAGATYTLSISYPEAKYGNAVSAVWNANLFGAIISANVSAPGTVTVSIYNGTGSSIYLPLGTASVSILLQ